MSDYTQVERVALNKGLNLRDTPETLQEGQWRRLTNVRSFAEGTLSTRPGRQWYGGPSTGQDVHTLVKLGNTLFSGSGRGFYNDTRLLEQFNGRALSWVKHTSESNDERWLYVTDGNKYRMFNSDGSIIYWGIQANPTPCSFSPSTEQGALTTDVPGADVYDWRVVYLNTRTGARSNPTPVAPGIQIHEAGSPPFGKKARVVTQTSPDGQVDKIELYRRGGLNGLGEWRLTLTVANQETGGAPGEVVMLDNLSDSEAALGRVLEIDNHLPFTSTDPVTGDAVYGAAFNLLWGPLDGRYIFAAGDPNRPGHVYWTNPGRPHSASPANHVSVSPTDEPIVGGFVFGGVSYCWTRENLYALDFQGDDALITFLPRRTYCGRGLSLPNAFAVGPMIWFFSKDGLYVTDGQSPAEPFTEADIRPLFNPQVEDRAYVAPGMLGAIQWPALTLGTDTGPDAATSDEEKSFTLSLSTTSLSAPIGGAAASVTITPVVVVGPIYRPLSLWVDGTPPPGVTYSWEVGPTLNPPNPGPAQAAILNFTATTGATAGSWSFVVKGQRLSTDGVRKGPVAVSALITLTITGAPTPTGALSLTLNPATVDLARGATATVQIGVQGDSNYPGDPVALTLSTPATGITATIATPTVTPPATLIPLTLTASRNTSLGISTLTLTGTSSATPPVIASASLSLRVTEDGAPVPDQESFSMLRMCYGGQELHVHYKDRLGQWIHLRNHLPYGRWCNDESPEIPVGGAAQSIHETITYYDEEAANTTLLIGTSLGRIAVERGTYDYSPAGMIQCRVRDRSDDFGSPRTLKELGNVIVEADVGDAVLPRAINPSQPRGISMVPFLNSEGVALSYQRIARVVAGGGVEPGRVRHPRALSTSNGGQPVFGYSLGMDFQWNGNATLYGWLVQLHPDEELITEWAFGPTTHGLKGWQHVRDLYLTLRTTAALTPTVEVDGVSYPLYYVDPDTKVASTTIPSTGGAKQKVHLWAPALKGKVYRWKLSGTQFRIYGNECEMRVKEFSSGLGYQVLNPFQGGMAEV